MKAAVTEMVKKVTLELVYEVVDERTKEIKEELKSLNERFYALSNEHREDYKALNTRIDQLYDRIDRLSAEHKDDYKALNARLDQIHTRLDQIMHMLAELRR